MPKKDEKCEYCGMMFVKVKSHYPHCDVKALTDEAHDKVGADGTIDSDEPIISPGPATELEVPGSATEGVITDRFWAWTEGLGLQIRIIIDSFTGLTSELRTLNTTLTELKDNAGNSYMALKNIKEHLSIVSDSFADAFEIIKHGKIIDEDRVEELKKASPLKPIRKSSPGFGTAPAKTQEQADLEAFEESKEIFESGGVVSGIVHWENDKSLPEHTRKLAGTVQGVTEKAILVKFFNGKEGWLPKSTIKSTVDETKTETQQNFIIDSWVLKKNTIIGENE
jgi:hypothetical protein